MVANISPLLYLKWTPRNMNVQRVFKSLNFTLTIYSTQHSHLHGQNKYTKQDNQAIFLSINALKDKNNSSMTHEKLF